ncbi:MAG TPA: hypothetical protein VM577_03015 [Anaerovoracaceae bacterium]|nr:hypothetical protein [Anaerovoracaceae bacterium]
MKIYDRPDPYMFYDTQEHVFQEDLDLIENYNLEQLNEYIANFEITLREIEDKTLKSTEEKYEGHELGEHSFFQDNPFRMYFNPDPAGDHGRIYIKKYDPEVDLREDFNDCQMLGKYVVGFYDVTSEPIEFFKEYMQKLVLVKRLEQANPVKEIKEPMSLRDLEPLNNGGTRTRSNKIKI